MSPRLFGLIAAAVLLAIPASASAQPADRQIEVLELSGPFDDRVINFAIDSINRAATAGNVEVVILQIDSPGVTGTASELKRLADLLTKPPLPIITWVGPGPATAYGGVAQLMSVAPLRAVAPGAGIGYWVPAIAGEETGVIAEPSTPAVLDAVLTVTGPVAGLIDLASDDTASIRQLVQLLDGRVVAGQTLATLRPFTDAEGAPGVTALPTVIRQPGLWDRFLRLASTPEAAFFFLVAGLTIAAFEFFAIGPGNAAVVAAISLLAAGYGLAVLPVRGWAVALTVVSIGLMSVSYQRGGIAVFTGLGLVGLAVGGVMLTDAAPQIRPGVAGVVLTVLASAFFFLLAMPTVARARFSTQTIGRQSLNGRRGIAVSDLTPDGEVEVDGARWRATSHREAGIRQGEIVSVTGVEGWYLEVEPIRNNLPESFQDFPGGP